VLVTLLLVVAALTTGSPGDLVRAASDRPLPVAFRRRTRELGDDRLVSLVLVFPLLRSRPGCVRQVPRHRAPAPVAGDARLLSRRTSDPRTTATSDQRPTAPPRPAGKVPGRGDGKGEGRKGGTRCSSCRG
jgi:hypothetical protein